MKEHLLYIKDGKRYKVWGKIYDAFGSALPFGIWWVRKNSASNLEDRLISSEDLQCKPVVSRRIAVKELILKYFLDKHNNGEALSYEDMSNELAKLLVTSNPRNKITTKGLRLRSHKNLS